MLGFIVGTASLVGLAAVAHHHRHGCGHGAHGYDGCGGHRHGYRGGIGAGGGRSRWLLRRVFERLDTSPSQEKVILDGVDAVREAARGARGELRQSREDLAKALRAERLDVQGLSPAFDRNEATLRKVREVAVAQLGRVHEALDERQRRTLAELVEGFGGPFGLMGGC